MKKHIFILPLLLITLTIGAQTKMIVTDKSGNVTTFPLNEVTIVYFGEGGLSATDLGLPSGTLWATCNVGALKPEESGTYYAWGETDSKANYTKTLYSMYDTAHGVYPYEDFMDDISGSTYDAATVVAGSPWKLPTVTQVNELIAQCTWTWGTRNGVQGYTVTGSNGQSIFLPACGKIDGQSLTDGGSVGYFWVASIADRSDNEAYTLEISSDKHSLDYEDRYKGLSIRPVQ